MDNEKKMAAILAQSDQSWKTAEDFVVDIERIAHDGPRGKFDGELIRLACATVAGEIYTRQAQRMMSAGDV